MLYKVVSGATLVIASMSILAQIVLLPLLFQHSINLKHDFQARMRAFHHNARTFDDHINQIHKIYGVARALGVVKADKQLQHRFARQLTECPPPRPGPPGSPGDPAPDGEQGDAGNDGASGIDAYQLLLEEAQKCVECPAGPVGPMGAPGLQGFMGPKGDKGDPGLPGKDGIDGDQGEEGFSGRRGLAGKPGRKGVDGVPAPGGQGPPGPPGVKGPVGTTGAQGERGKRNYVIGPPGQDGRPGKAGLDGIEGKAGPRGEKGEKGEVGADARFCPCPIELSSGSREKKKSHLVPLDSKTLSQERPVSASQTTLERSTLQQPQSDRESVSKLEIQPLPLSERRSPSPAPRPPAPSAPGDSRAPGGEQTPVNSNLAYEDVYPNYDGEQRARAHSNSRIVHAPGADHANYDEDTPDDEAMDGNTSKLRELGSPAEQPENSPQRRFVYVTKRPRPN